MPLDTEIILAIVLAMLVTAIVFWFIVRFSNKALSRKIAGVAEGQETLEKLFRKLDREFFEFEKIMGKKFKKVEKEVKDVEVEQMVNESSSIEVKARKK